MLSFIQVIPNDDDDDDGFQSASSVTSDEKPELAVDESDLWSRALTQAENRYFTWEQRGR